MKMSSCQTTFILQFLYFSMFIPPLVLYVWEVTVVDEYIEIIWLLTKEAKRTSRKLRKFTALQWYIRGDSVRDNGFWNQDGGTGEVFKLKLTGIFTLLN